MAQLVHRSLSHSVLGSAFSVANILGPGLLEAVYEQALVIELTHQGLQVEQQKAFPVFYKGELTGAYLADLVVEDTIILELKSVKEFAPAHEAQLVNYLRISKLPVGYLINFRNPKVQYRRFVNLKSSSR